MISQHYTVLKSLEFQYLGEERYWTLYWILMRLTKLLSQCLRFLSQLEQRF